MTKRLTIDVHIVLAESGAYVVDADPNEAAERANDEFPDDDVRQITLTLQLQPPSTTPEPTSFKMQVD